MRKRKLVLCIFYGNTGNSISITSIIVLFFCQCYFFHFIYFALYRRLLCSWDKSLNIGSCMLRIFLKVHSFTFDSLNRMQQIRSYSFNILVIGQKSFVFLMRFWIIWLCVCYNQRVKRDYLEKWSGPLNKFPRNWFLHDMISWERHDALHVSNNWLQTVQTVKCKGVNFEENSQHTASNIQALISTTQ